ncbi:LA_2272 family surface repeat-containing protein [Chryseolinea sp. T2]|uniref:LA_2272 family surface repeat-containing protein n=1 Tax=Chryseolinea sp. T2 TaxID=3129255 RepID=UPI003077D5B5
MRKRTFTWLPAPDSKTNGVAVGLVHSGINDVSDSASTVVNGLTVELFGFGILLPIVPASPIYDGPDSVYRNKAKMDSIISPYNRARSQLNGLVLSGTGLVNRNLAVRGVNISVLNTFTAKTNGLSACVLWNVIGVVNGVSVGIFNSTVQTKGLQIGLFNSTTNLRGIQLGLLNGNGKRWMPFVNWNFR